MKTISSLLSPDTPNRHKILRKVLRSAGVRSRGLRARGRGTKQACSRGGVTRGVRIATSTVGMHMLVANGPRRNAHSPGTAAWGFKPRSLCLPQGAGQLRGYAGSRRQVEPPFRCLRYKAAILMGVCHQHIQEHEHIPLPVQGGIQADRRHLACFNYFFTQIQMTHLEIGYAIIFNDNSGKKLARLCI